MLVVMICRVALNILNLIPISILSWDLNMKLYLYSSKRDSQKNLALPSICLNINLVKLPFQQIIVDTNSWPTDDLRHEQDDRVL